MNDRDDEVLTLMSSTFVALTPAMIARGLNWLAPCEWCPVLPPRRGEKCASVPPQSAAKVLTVLRRLHRQGKVKHVFPGTRLRHWKVASHPV